MPFILAAGVAMNVSIFAPFSELAMRLLPLLSGTDGAHDISHLIRVWRNAKAIQLEEGGDIEILAAAVLLHDCVEVPKDSPLRSQASRLAAVEAMAQLKALGWTVERAKWVASRSNACVSQQAMSAATSLRLLRPQRTALVVVGDVSGKAMPAAMTVRSLLARRTPQLQQRALPRFSPS